jgi:hypothetical protein
MEVSGRSASSLGHVTLERGAPKSTGQKTDGIHNHCGRCRNEKVLLALPGVGPLCFDHAVMVSVVKTLTISMNDRSIINWKEFGRKNLGSS